MVFREIQSFKTFLWSLRMSTVSQLKLGKTCVTTEKSPLLIGNESWTILAPTTCFQLKAQNSVKIKESDFNFDRKFSLKLEAKIKKACDFRPKLNFGIPPIFLNVFQF